MASTDGGEVEPDEIPLHSQKHQRSIQPRSASQRVVSATSKIVSSSKIVAEEEDEVMDVPSFSQTQPPLAESKGSSAPAPTSKHFDEDDYSPPDRRDGERLEEIDDEVPLPRRHSPPSSAKFRSEKGVLDAPSTFSGLDIEVRSKKMSRGKKDADKISSALDLAEKTTPAIREIHDPVGRKDFLQRPRDESDDENATGASPVKPTRWNKTATPKSSTAPVAESKPEPDPNFFSSYGDIKGVRERLKESAKVEKKREEPRKVSEDEKTGSDDSQEDEANRKSKSRSKRNEAKDVKNSSKSGSTKKKSGSKRRDESESDSSDERDRRRRGGKKRRDYTSEDSTDSDSDKSRNRRDKR